MRRRTFALITAAALALATVTVAAGRPAATPTLKGTVGPGFTITLKKTKGGKFEKELTDVSDTGSKTATIKLTRGTWKYYCEPHESTMFGSFTVT